MAFESYRGKLIALTFSSVLKIGDNDQLPFNTVGRPSDVVFENNLRTKEPNALANITDGDGAVTSLAIGAQNAGAKIFGPVQICNVGGGEGETSSVKFLCVDGGGACITGDLDVNGTVDGGTITGTTGNFSGTITGNSLCSNTTIQSTGGITAAGTIEATGVNIVKGGTLCATVAICSDGDIIAFASSDKSLKNNIKLIDNSSEILDKINGYEFDWKDEADRNGHDFGVIAQEIQEVMPDAVRKNSNNYLAVDYQKLIPVLIQEVKSLNNKIKVLEDKING